MKSKLRSRYASGSTRRLVEYLIAKGWTPQRRNVLVLKRQQQPADANSGGVE